MIFSISDSSSSEDVARVICEDEINTHDLPVARLSAFNLHGKAAEFMMNYIVSFIAYLRALFLSYISSPFVYLYISYFCRN